MSSKTSLNLLGGGVTGAFFHFGALAALDDHLSKKTVDHDVFVGTSAGSLVATLMSQGMQPQELVEAVMKEHRDTFSITRKDIYRFSPLDIGGEVLKFIYTLFYITYMKIQHPEEAPSYFWGMKDSLPSGLFSMRYYEKWIRDIMESNNLPLFFSQLKKELYIPSYDLDSVQRVVFGRTGLRHVSFAKAIAASSAIPIFFRPVEIEKRHFVDGGLGDTAHLDISAAAGANLIIMINPMVPVRNDLESVKLRTVYSDKGRIAEKGLTYVFDQGLRCDIRLRVHASLRYMGYLFPDVDILLIEPDEEDATMFMINPMDFESRKLAVEYSYELTRRKLKENAELWKTTLDRHGITLVGV